MRTLETTRRTTLALATLLGTIALLAHTAGAARADCAAPHPFVAAPDDGIVPPNPVVYVFSPDGLKLTGVRIEGRDQATLGVDRAAAPGTAAWNVTRVAVTAAKPGKITVVATFEGWTEQPLEVRRELTIRAAPRRPVPTEGAPTAATPPAATVVDYGVSQYGWSCSHENVRELGVDVVAPAYRVELMSGGEVRQVAVFPRTSDSFYPGSARTGAVLALGHINCLGESFDWRGLRDAALRVTALLPDGAEVQAPTVRVPAP